MILEKREFSSVPHFFSKKATIYPFFPVYINMRRSRILMRGATYHVTARTNRKEMLLSSQEEKEYFLKVIKQAKKKYSFCLISFCIMNNHIHFVIKPEKEENLSRIMQWILSVFAMSWNRRHKMTGHFWGSRLIRAEPD